MISGRAAQMLRRQVLPGLQRLIAAEPEWTWQHILQTARTIDVDPTTVWRWVRNGNTAKTLGRPQGSGKVVVDDALEGLYMQCGFNVAMTLRRAIELGIFDAESAPCKSTLRRAILRQIPRVRREMAQHGDKGVRDFAMSYLAIDAPYRGATYMMDHCVMPIYVIPPHPHKGVLKPALTPVMDAATRVVLSYEVTFQPCSGTICHALARAVAPDPDGRNQFYGIPENLLVDNGSDFLAKHTETAMARIGTVITPHVAYRPNMKGKVERLFHDIQLELQGLPGYAYGPKTIDNQRQFTAEDGWLDYTQMRPLIQRIVDRYNNTLHSSLGCTPAEAWASDATVLASLPDMATATQMMMDGEKRTVTKNGIAKFSKYFTCPEIATRKGDELEIRFFPNDERAIYIYEHGKYLATAEQPLEMTPDERHKFIGERERQLKEAKRTIKRIKRQYRYTMGPLTDDGSEPELLTVGPARETEPAVPAADAASDALAFGGIDKSFPVAD